MPDQVRIRALRRAAEICGGVPQLAARLKTSEDIIQRMLMGWDRIGLELFTDMVDVLLEADLASLGGDEKPTAERLGSQR